MTSSVKLKGSPAGVRSKGVGAGDAVLVRLVRLVLVLVLVLLLVLLLHVGRMVVNARHVCCRQRGHVGSRLYRCAITLGFSTVGCCCCTVR